jgi:hypothetical protein
LDQQNNVKKEPINLDNKIIPRTRDAAAITSCISELLSMGFSGQSAREAAERYDGDIAKAANFLTMTPNAQPPSALDNSEAADFSSVVKRNDSNSSNISTTSHNSNNQANINKPNAGTCISPLHPRSAQNNTTINPSQSSTNPFQINPSQRTVASNRPIMNITQSSNDMQIDHDHSSLSSSSGTNKSTTFHSPAKSQPSSTSGSRRGSKDVIMDIPSAAAKTQSHLSNISFSGTMNTTAQSNRQFSSPACQDISMSPTPLAAASSTLKSLQQLKPLTANILNLAVENTQNITNKTTNLTPTSTNNGSTAADKERVILPKSEVTEGLILRYLSQLPPPTSLSSAAQNHRLTLLKSGQISLQPGSYLDVRDTPGKWLEAEVKFLGYSLSRPRDDFADTVATGSFNHLWLRVHYLLWPDPKWDETISLASDWARIAEFREWSEGSNQGEERAKGIESQRPKWLSEGVEVAYYYQARASNNDTENSNNRAASRWIQGRIKKLDGLQAQVECFPAGKTVQRWAHARSDCIIPISQIKHQISHGINTEASTKLAQMEFFQGQMLEIRDTADQWLPAEVLTVENSKVYVHFINWSAKWDCWLDCVAESQRIRPLGSDIQESNEEKQKKIDETAFRESLLSSGYEIFDCAADGNCLFRAFSHQIYGSDKFHGQIRAKCYSYMEKYRKFFENYVAEDFSGYLQRQRQPNEWGDHLEIVAMQEIFNKNVLLFAKDSTKQGKPIGGAALSAEQAAQIKTVRLSFHGNNHYNSVIDPADPPPLGEGQEAPIQMKLVREQSEEQENNSTDEAKLSHREEISQSAREIGPNPSSSSKALSASTLPALGISESSPITEITNELSSVSTRGPRTPSVAARSLMRDLSADISFSEEELRRLWKMLDKRGSGALQEGQIIELVQKIGEFIYTKQANSIENNGRALPLNSPSSALHRTARPQQVSARRALERLQKSYDELNSGLEQRAKQLIEQIREKNGTKRSNLNSSSSGGAQPLSYAHSSHTLPRNFHSNDNNNNDNNDFAPVELQRRLAVDSSNIPKLSYLPSAVPYEQFKAEFMQHLLRDILWDLKK